MEYVIGTNRNQLEFTSLDMMVREDSPVRVIDSFVEKTLKGQITFKTSKRPVMGRPSYNPLSMIKLYLYGYMIGVKSSRKLAHLVKVNIEAMWLVEGLTPDFRTIAEFRKNNIEAITEVFIKFKEFCVKDLASATGKNVFGGYKSIDGTKIRAVQAKDGVYTANKIDDRIANDNTRIAEIKSYLSELDANDHIENNEELNVKKEELEKALKAYEDRKAKHVAIREIVEKTGEQYAENDSDSRLMKNHYGGYNPSFNVQTAVDSESHMIENVEVTNHCTDHGLIEQTASGCQKEDDKIIEIVADNGYEQPEDMAACLENGIKPNVFLSKVENEEGYKVHKKEIELSFDYEEKEISEAEKASTKSEDIKKCLHAGVVPNCYKTCLEVEKDEKGNTIVKTTRTFNISDEDPMGIDNLTDEQKIDLAAQGYFVRDIKADKVYCPAGTILRRKSVKAKGSIRYANKLACSKCPFKDICFNTTKTTKWKEVDFSRNCRIKKAKFRNDGKDEEIADIPKPTGTRKQISSSKKVVFRFKPDREKLDKRKCLSEHPFGTIKRYMNGDHFLLKGLRKVKAEIFLTAIGYNFKRLISLFSAPKLLTTLGK